MHVHGEDKSRLRRIKIKGKQFDVTEIEATLYWYLDTEGCKVKIALHGDEIVGFLIYNSVLDGVFATRLLYVLPEYYGTKTGESLISSMGKVKTVIFQTKKDITPEGLHAVMRGREQKIGETDHAYTWIMNWEK
jgi:hypothetical protein